MTTTADRPLTSRVGVRGIAVYVTVVIGLVVPANLFAGALGANAKNTDQAPVAAQFALYAQAVIPTIAALLAWAAMRQRPDFGFRRTPWRVLAAAWLIGVLTVIIGYGAAWPTGAADLSVDGLSDTWGGLPPWCAALAGLSVGVLPWLLLAIGEELGWNSFLAVQLAKRVGADRTALAVGLLWAAFHVPLMLFVPGAVPAGVPPLWTVAIFTVECIALAFPLVWLRLRTRSIWPALVLHGTLNAALYLVAEPATTVTDASGWFVGEGGLLTSAGTLIAVIGSARLWRRTSSALLADRQAHETSRIVDTR